MEWNNVEILFESRSSHDWLKLGAYLMPEDCWKQ